MYSFPGRPVYQPSGRCNWLLFVPLVVAAFGVAIGMGWVLAEVFHAGLYYFVVVPLVANWPIMGVLYLAVTWGQCRSPALLIAVAIMASLVLHGSYFHFDHIRQEGPEVAGRLDRLPEHIAHRIQTDQIGDRPGDQPKPEPKNWMELGYTAFLLLTDVVIVMVMLCVVLHVKTRVPFSEEDGCWFQQQTVRIQREAEAPIVSALLAHDHAALAAALTPPVATGAAHLEWNLCYRPQTPDSVVYAQLMFHQPEGSEGNASRQPLTAWIMLHPDEARAIAARFPLPGATFAPTVSADQPAPTPADTSPWVQVLSAVSAGPRVLSRWNILIAAGYSFSPLLLVLLLPVILIGYLLYTQVAWQELLLVGIIGTWIALALGLRLAGQYGASLAARYYRRCSRAAVRTRSDAVVDCNDLTALFVQVIPRKNWQRTVLENAREMGWLRIDVARQLLLFEGDRERWAIPGHELRGLSIGVFTPADQDGSCLFPAVLLQTCVRQQVWEAPISTLNEQRKQRTNEDRQRAAEQLLAAVRRVCPPTEQVAIQAVPSVSGQ